MKHLANLFERFDISWLVSKESLPYVKKPKISIDRTPAQSMVWFRERINRKYVKIQSVQIKNLHGCVQGNLLGTSYDFCRTHLPIVTIGRNIMPMWFLWMCNFFLKLSIYHFFNLWFPVLKSTFGSFVTIKLHYCSKYDTD